MRSLRLAAIFRKEPRQDIDEKQPDEDMRSVKDTWQTTLNDDSIAKSFANWKQVEEIRTTGKVPLTSEETSRLAKIFSSTYSATEK